MVRGLRPTATVVSALTVLLGILIALAVVGAGLGLVQGLFFPEAAGDDDPQETGAILLLLATAGQALLYLFVYIPTVVLFCVFVHRSSWNARRLGAEGFEHSPGLAVGSFFIPFAHLVIPYRAVREIYLASDPEAGPADWRGRPTPGLLPAWWTLWLASNFLGTLALRAAFSKNASAQALSPWFDVADGIVDVPLCLLALWVVKAIHRRQAAKGQRALTSVA